ncbi:response regulator transcription factor [Candidatus Peregrinibacteria bacterium]|nr:MAG: response regulator transcription factor [Candidatus Peregrinibacteria bacterium]
MKVLVVEDDVAVQKLLSKNFALKQCQIDQVYDGDTALKRLRSNDYSLAIVDLMLPNLGGAQLVSAVRNMGIKTPVIVLSALQDLVTKTRLLDAGADDYVVKPFSFEELYARILAVIRRTKDDFGEQDLIFDGLELVPDHTTLLINGKPCKLRRKEHELIQYLMHHAKMVVSEMN